jgi:hypothetical protein
MLAICNAVKAPNIDDPEAKTRYDYARGVSALLYSITRSLSIAQQIASIHGVTSSRNRSPAGPIRPHAVRTTETVPYAHSEHALK